MKTLARARFLSPVGALIAAMASSACCWLPLLLMGFGLSVGGLSAWFERYRVPFLIAAAVFLAIGFALAYRRAPACADGACQAGGAPAKRGTQRAGRASLWISAVVIIAFAAFPKYASALLPSSPTAALSNSGDAEPSAYTLSGLTCEVCAVHAREEVLKVPGVADASVSYENSRLVVVPVPGADIPTEAVIEAVTRAGYHADPETQPTQKADPSP